MRLNFLSLASIVMISMALFSCKCERKNAATAEDTNSVAQPVVSTTAPLAGKLDSLSGNYIYETGALTDINLPGGIKISQVGANSTESQLYKMLSDSTLTVSDDKTQGSITLDRVYFDTGKSTMTADSENQIKNIVEILKAFPTGTVKIGGYTDNTGPAETNKKVSTERATSILTKLTGSGIDSARITSEGYGPEYPVCQANDTKECQAQNRRVDIRITKK